MGNKCSAAHCVETSYHENDVGLANDVGLIFLADKVDGPYSKIGGPYPKPNSKVTAAGFGAIDGNATILTKYLIKVELPVASVEDCRNAVMPINVNFISNVEFCTSITEGRAICHGDSGGPVYADVDGEQRVLGIASFIDTEICDHNGSHNYFVYITPFILWINKEIEKFEKEQRNGGSMSINGKV
ncbi:unnamed protein product [Mortierella alpina]